LIRRLLANIVNQLRFYTVYKVKVLRSLLSHYYHTRLSNILYSIINRQILIARLQVIINFIHFLNIFLVSVSIFHG